MARWLLALLLAGCSAASDAVESVGSGLDCALHPSRWDNSCVECQWHVAYPVDAVFACSDVPPHDCATYRPGDCSADGVTLECDGGVTVHYDVPAQTAEIVVGDCHDLHHVHIWRKVF